MFFQATCSGSCFLQIAPMYCSFILYLLTIINVKLTVDIGAASSKILEFLQYLMRLAVIFFIYGLEEHGTTI